MAILAGLFMHGFLAAELTILFQLKPFGVILLVLHGTIITIFAFRTSQGDPLAHRKHLRCITYNYKDNLA